MRARLALGAAALGLACAASPAIAHQGNPNFRSTVRAVAPENSGIEARVLNYDDRLELRNRGKRTVTVLGYDGEPYARLAADGTVSVNRRSPATYLNEERFAGVDLPAEADAEARPLWRVLDRTGRFEWHDHRAHWMAKTTPPQVKDEERRTKVFDWRVPLAVSGTKGTVRGDLYWVPSPSGSLSAGPVIGLIALAVFGGAGVLLLRRRRRAGGGGEAW